MLHRFFGAVCALPDAVLPVLFRHPVPGADNPPKSRVPGGAWDAMRRVGDLRVFRCGAWETKNRNGISFQGYYRIPN